MSNLRRSAAHHSGSQGGSSTTTKNSFEKNALIPILSKTDRYILDLQCRLSPDSVTEASIYMVFVLKSCLYTARASLEQGIFNISSIIAVCSVDYALKHYPNHFLLPLTLIGKFDSLHPKFNDWIVCGNIYRRTFNDSSKNIEPSYKSNLISKMSENQNFYAFIAPLIGTTELLFSLEETASTDTIMVHLYMLMVSIKKLLQQNLYIPDQSKVLEDCDMLKRLITNRDNTSDDAKAYQTFVDELHPIQYSTVMCYLMITDYDLFHKSNTCSIELVLYGLLSFTCIESSERQVDFNTIIPFFIRMVMERSLKHVPSIKTEGIIDEDRLIEHIQSKAGRQFQNTLRNMTFLIKSLEIYISFGKTWESHQILALRLRKLKHEIKGLAGLSSLIMVASPSTISYLNDRQLAEFLLQTNLLKGAVLSSEMLFTHCGTPLFDVILHKNIEYDREANTKYKEPELGPVAKASTEEEDNLSEPLDIRTTKISYDMERIERMKRTTLENPITSIYRHVKSLCDVLCHSEYTINEEVLTTLKHLIDNPCISIGGIRLRTVISVCLPPNITGELYHIIAFQLNLEYLPRESFTLLKDSKCKKLRELRAIMSRLTYINRLNRYETVHIQLAKASAKASAKVSAKASVVEDIEYVPLDISMAVAIEIISKPEQFECYVCFSDCHMMEIIPFHTNKDLSFTCQHGMCSSCYPVQGDLCNICRQSRAIV